MIYIVQFIRRIAQQVGIDGAILYTSLGKIIQSLGGFVSLLFIAKYLTGVEQGFFYTFGSILAIQIFFELGLNNIITQYVAHEVSHLSWDTGTQLSGSTYHLSRLSSLLHFCVKWYSIFSAILLVVLMIAGFTFFRTYGNSSESINWEIPWIILAFSTTFSFLLSPILAFFEGLGMIKQIAMIRMIQQTVTILIISIALFLGAKLYASGISSLFGLLLLVFLTLSKKRKNIIKFIWESLNTEHINYKKEIFPFQWKIALSWISGYFIFQLFNPVIFATEGPIAAGQMGMTLTALNSILSLSLSWMTTKIPLFSGLIAKKQYDKLDHIFNRTLKQSVSINGLGILALLAIIIFLRFWNIPLGGRFLPYLPLGLMMIPVFINQFVSSWAIYLRCHKQEPFLINSIVGAISISLSTILLGKYFGLLGITAGYCLLTIGIGLIWGFIIFKTKKSLWHA